MKIFVSFKFTGEDYEDVQKTMSQILTALRARGFEVYCNIESEEKYIKDKYTAQQIFADTLPNLDKSDMIFVFNNSENRSEGMLIEIGYALAKGKPIFLAAKKGITINSSKAVSTKVLEFEDLEDLLEKIKTIDLTV